MAKIEELAKQMKRNKSTRTNASKPSSRNVTTNSIPLQPQPISTATGSAVTNDECTSNNLLHMHDPPVEEAHPTIIQTDGDYQKPRGDKRAPPTQSTRRAKKSGPCHFGCLTTAQSNWECSPSGSSWWGIPPGTALCHAHYLRGWRYSRKHGHDPPGYDAPNML